MLKSRFLPQLQNDILFHVTGHNIFETFFMFTLSQQSNMFTLFPTKQYVYLVPIKAICLSCSHQSNMFTLFPTKQYVYLVPIKAICLPCSQQSNMFTLFPTKQYVYLVPNKAICLPCSRQTRDCRLEPSQTVSVSSAVQSGKLASVSPNNKNTSYKSIAVVRETIKMNHVKQ